MLVSLVAAATAWSSANETVLVSTGDSTGRPSMSDDGRYFAYTSSSGQAVRKDLQTGEVEVVSVHEGAGGATANDVIGSPLMSSDGRYVAFGSTDQDLDEDYDDGFPDVSVVQIFVRDVALDETTIASRADGADGRSVTSFADLGGISDDGRYVAFKSGDDLDFGTTTFENYFRRDLQTGETDLVNVADDETPAEPGGGELPILSGNGRFVLFATSEPLAGDDTDTGTDAYRRDVEGGTTAMVSRATGGAPIDDEGVNPRAVSRDGSRVVLVTESQIDPADDNAFADTYLRDIAANITILVSRKDGAGGGVGPERSLASGPETISPDGRFVVFTSRANLVRAALGSAGLPEDSGVWSNVYLRDVQESETVLVSRPNGSTTTEGNGPSTGGSVSADGRFVGFASEATNLTASDSTTDNDSFRRELFGQPTDPTDPTDPGADTEILDPDVTAKKKQVQKGKKIKIKVGVSAGEPVAIVGKGRINVKRGKKGNKRATAAATKFKLKTQKKSIGAGEATVLRLKPKKKKDTKKIFKLLKKGKDLRANPSVRFTDAAGNTAREKRVVRLKYKKGGKRG